MHPNPNITPLEPGGQDVEEHRCPECEWTYVLADDTVEHRAAADSAYAEHYRTEHEEQQKPDEG